jgi:hypothetical protein
MKAGDLVRVNDRWQVQGLGPGMESWIEPGSVAVLVEHYYQGTLSWGWQVLIGERQALLNECYMEAVDEAG